MYVRIMDNLMIGQDTEFWGDRKSDVMVEKKDSYGKRVTFKRKSDFGYVKFNFMWNIQVEKLWKQLSNKRLEFKLEAIIRIKI